MPALKKCKNVNFAGVGIYRKEERFADTGIDEYTFSKLRDVELNKAKVFVENYGGRIFDGYDEIISSSLIDAIYIPLPPALHSTWAQKALNYGKHVLVEKPCTTSLKETKKIIDIANKNNLAVHENYMFVFHDQIKAIKEIINKGELGEIRLYRICFGFPMRAVNDFRYNKQLGGGALIDAGGYTIQLATQLIGPTAKIKYAQSNFLDSFDVDIYGSAALTNDEGVTAQIAFGMDNDYKCELEIWGSKGTLRTNRILTAPAGFIPTAIIRKNNEDVILDLPEDDTFYKSIQFFVNCINDVECRKKRYSSIVSQSELVDEFKEKADLE